MVDLVKIRKKKAEKKAEASERNAGVPPVSVDVVDVVDEVDFSGRPPSPPSPLSPSTAETPAPSTTSTLENFKAEVGKRRAFETAKSDESTSETQLELLTFVIAGEQYAVDIERIVEIVTPRAVARIPNADTSVVGIMSVRGVFRAAGALTILLDLDKLLDHGALAARSA
jgi:hypothetical protein